MSNVPQFAEGELVNLTIRAARYVETSDNGDGHREYSFDLPGLVEPFFLPAHAAIQFERVAPAEWPPQPGDIWVGANGAEWITTASDGETILMRVVDSDSEAVDALDVLRDYGPVRLVRRRGWSPATDTAPAAPEPEQVDKRAEYVAGLRRIADLIESRTDLPVPYGNAGQIEFRTREELERVAAEFDVKLHSSDTHDRGEIQMGGVYLNLCWFRPKPKSWTCPHCAFTTMDVEAGLEHISEHEPAPLPHRQPDEPSNDGCMSLDEALADADAQGLLAETLGSGVSS